MLDCYERVNCGTYICVSMAALGDPVVPVDKRYGKHSHKYVPLLELLPDVNCKFKISSGVTAFSAHSHRAPSTSDWFLETNARYNSI